MEGHGSADGRRRPGGGVAPHFPLWLLGSVSSPRALRSQHAPSLSCAVQSCQVILCNSVQHARLPCHQLPKFAQTHVH